jgi:hypothetical protein
MSDCHDFSVKSIQKREVGIITANLDFNRGLPFFF